MVVVAVVVVVVVVVVDRCGKVGCWTGEQKWKRARPVKVVLFFSLSSFIFFSYCSIGGTSLRLLCFSILIIGQKEIVEG